MDKHKINLKSKRRISLSENQKKVPPSVSKYSVTIRVPDTNRRALIEIEMKLQNLGVKRMFDQDKWHVGLNLFNKLLDYVDESNIDENTDILEHIEKIIEDKMQ